MDFFAQFPELVGDIPVCGSISPNVSWTRGERFFHARMAEREQHSTESIAEVGSQGNEVMTALAPASQGFVAVEAVDPGVCQALSPENACTWPSV